MFCAQCGTEIKEDTAYCCKCGAKIIKNKSPQIFCTESKGYGVNIDQGKGSDNGKKKTWMEWLLGPDYLKLPVFLRWVLVILILAGGVLTFFLLAGLLSAIFSSFISMIIAAAGGYILYHKIIAGLITAYIYKKKSKELQLPEGMSASMLLEALSGKFNYPYFKGVHYGADGECVIEGKYSMYPVVFGTNNIAEIDCILKKNEKKVRAVLLEAMAIRDYINKFFNPNLPVDVVKDMKKLKLAEGQRKAVAFVWTAASILIAAAIVWDCVSPGSLQNMAVPGIEVRGAYLSQYSTKVTIEEAFENFFDNCKWTKYKSEGYTYVAFTGTCLYLDERADVRIVFKVTGEKFIVDSLDINGQTRSNLILYGMLSKVYEDY